MDLQWVNFLLRDVTVADNKNNNSSVGSEQYYCLVCDLENGADPVSDLGLYWLCVLQVLLKELEEFAFKGIPDARGMTVETTEIMRVCIVYVTLVAITGITILVPCL